MYSVLLICGLAFGADKPGVEQTFSEIEIEQPFRRFLISNPLLMEVTGAKVIRLPKGRVVVFGVASTALKDNSAKDRLRAERVCRAKALAYVVGERKGIQVAHTEELREETTIVIDQKGETGKSVSDLLQTTKTKVDGIAKDMPVIGRWRSKDGDVFYLALGVVLDEHGDPDRP